MFVFFSPHLIERAAGVISGSFASVVVGLVIPPHDKLIRLQVFHFFDYLGIKLGLVSVAFP